MFPVTSAAAEKGLWGEKGRYHSRACHIRSSTHEFCPRSAGRSTDQGTDGTVPAALSYIERVRTLTKLLVTCMAESGVGHDVCVLEKVPDRDHIPQIKVCSSSRDCVVTRQFCGWTTNSLTAVYSIWQYLRFCLDPQGCVFAYHYITTHFDDEVNLKSSIGNLPVLVVHYINITPDKVGTVFGIACSSFHCIIVTSFERTKTSWVHHSPIHRH